MKWMVGIALALMLVASAQAEVVRLPTKCMPWEKDCQAPQAAQLPPCPAPSQNENLMAQMKRMHITACVRPDKPAAAPSGTAKLPWNP